MKISEIRDAIDTLNWNRSDLYGATKDEFRRMDVETRLMEHINICKSLDIKSRFARDIENCETAIRRALDMVKRWKATQEIKPSFEPRSEKLTCSHEYKIKQADEEELIEHLNKLHGHGQYRFTRQNLFNISEGMIYITVTTEVKPN